nr:23S rRNA (guanosine(2251)-2'-O)-methyltransferase RlmB [Desulfobulbaceae bacterium]
MPLPKPRKQKKSFAPNKPDAELIWGIHMVEELLQNRPESLVEVYFLKQTSTKLETLLRLCKEKHIPTQISESPWHLPEHAVHQGVMARIKPFATIDFAHLLRLAAKKTNPIILALDTIQDPHNFGAMIRSASAAGVTGILYTKDRSAPLSGTVAKVSAGAISNMPLCPITNMAESLSKLKDKGFWIYGADGSAEQSIYQAKLAGPICLVIGGEAKGIRPLVKKNCDFLISIPMQSALDSLNASTAAAIILFEVVRQQ